MRNKMRIPWCEGNYYVWRSGQVYSAYLRDFLVPSGNPYLHISLRRKGIKTHKSFSVHTIVCELFNGPSPKEGYWHVDHINGNTKDNRAENLEWVSPKENTKRAIKLGIARPVHEFCPHKKKPIVGLNKLGIEKERHESFHAAVLSGHHKWGLLQSLRDETKRHHGLFWKWI